MKRKIYTIILGLLVATAGLCFTAGCNKAAPTSDAGGIKMAETERIAENTDTSDTENEDAATPEELETKSITDTEKTSTETETKSNTIVATDTESSEDGDSEIQIYSMPDLVGMESSEAMQLLVAYDFNLSMVSYEYSDTIDVGKVISQKPVADAGVEYGAELTLVISKGEKDTVVPDVLGITAKDAEAKLENLGFQVANNAKAKDTIISYQSYAAGDSVKKGTVITIK